MNPNASEFQFNPSGGEPSTRESVTESSFTEYANMVESIEEELENDEANGLVEAMNDVAVKPAGPPQTGLPAHLAKHAAEFWFPECRDCACCKGFKHGCQCAAAHGGTCTCSAGTAPPMAAAAPAPSGGGGGGKKIPCKFFLSPGGCRFGDKCRFSHS